MGPPYRRILLQIPKVSFDLDKDFEANGTFMLVSSDGNYSFEWVADQTIDPKILSDHNIPHSVNFPFSHISQLVRRNLSLSLSTIRLKSTEDSSLPRFYFHYLPSLLTTHLIELLISLHLITAQKSAPHIFIFNYHSKVEDPSAAPPPSSLSPQQITALVTHNRILKQLNFQAALDLSPPVTAPEANELLKADEFDLLTQQIFTRGLSPEARPFVWPYLLGIFVPKSSPAEMADVLNKKTAIYSQILGQWGLYTERQFALSSALSDIRIVIENDVKRNDRTTEQFSGDDNPNLNVLRHALTAYSLFNRDQGYVQGMGDLMTPFIVLYIKGWKDGKAIFYDGSKRTATEAEAFVFWNFVEMMERTQHGRLFADLAAHQAFELERIEAIAVSVHPPLKSILDKNALNDLVFLFRPLLLLFKRDFCQADLLRLWDSLICSRPMPYFSRFIAAAILILLFPKILSSTDGTLGEVMNATDGFLERADVVSLIQLASTLRTGVVESNPIHDFVMQELPDNQMFANYEPKCMRFTE